MRAQKANWQKEATEQIRNACATSWGRKVLQNNPVVQDIFDVLAMNEITVEQRVELISNIENLYTFSNLISRTRQIFEYLRTFEEKDTGKQLSLWDLETISHY